MTVSATFSRGEYLRGTRPVRTRTTLGAAVSLAAGALLGCLPSATFAQEKGPASGANGEGKRALKFASPVKSADDLRRRASFRALIATAGKANEDPDKPTPNSK